MGVTEEGAAEAATRQKQAPGRPQLADGMRVVTVTDGPLRDEVEHFVYRIYREVGYCDVSPRERVEELQRWADESVWHVVLGEDDEIQGTGRTVIGGYDDLPVGAFDRIDHRLDDPMCELGALAVRPGARSTGLVEHVYREAWVRSAREGTNGFIAVLEPWLVEIMTTIYGFPFYEIGQGKHYLGGYSMPMVMPLSPESYEAIARGNPVFYAWNTEVIEPEEMAAWGMPIVLTDSVAEAVAAEDAAVPAPATAFDGEEPAPLPGG
jgi:hypothetical protein